NLEIDQLYYPKKLYNYLRNHHWKQGIPQDFISNWIQKISTNSHLVENDRLDFQIIFENLQLPQIKTASPNIEIQSPKEPVKNKSISSNKTHTKAIETIPPIEHFQEFKNWLLKRLDELENLL
ncbi:unnamed protein product, partial [marine sediment metagenome]